VEGRAYFFAAAAGAMRRILVERARRRGRLKHGGGLTRVSLGDVPGQAGQPDVELLALDEALSELEAHDKRMSEVVALRYFAGLEVEETAWALGVSPRTVKRDWNFARAWLYERMSRGGGGREREPRGER
jgi:RNA polymerase sigma factor (TIGR02999 family)